VVSLRRRGGRANEPGTVIVVEWRAGVASEEELFRTTDAISVAISGTIACGAAVDMVLARFTKPMMHPWNQRAWRGNMHVRTMEGKTAPPAVWARL
jgi:hypothetical protein